MNRWQKIRTNGLITLGVLAIAAVPSAAIYFLATRNAMLMFWAFAAAAGAGFLAVKYGEKFFTREVMVQITTILYFATVFVVTALVSPITIKTNVKWILFDVGIVGVLDLACAFLWKKLPRENEKKFTERIVDWFRENSAIAAVLIVLLFQRVWMIFETQRWDSAEYYYKLGTACSNYDFSFEKYFFHFRLCKHPTLGLAFIMAPGEFLLQRQVVGVMIISLALTLAAAWCIYRMFLGHYVKANRNQAAMAVLLTMSFPLIWGTFGYFNPDYFIAIFFVFFLYAESRKHYLSMIFWGALVSQCKETGVIIIFGYAVFRVITIFLFTRGWLFARIKAEICHLGNWAALAVGILYLGYAKLNGGMSTWTQSTNTANTTFSWSNTGYNCFGYRPDYIAERLKQFFVMNFAWVIWGLILLLILILFVRRVFFKKRDYKAEGHNLFPLIGAMAVYGAFNCLYVTSCIYRYHVFFVIMTGILFGALLLELTAGWKRGICGVILAALVCVMGAQTFATVDPLSSRMVDSVDTGKGSMLYSAWDTSYYGDYLVYNYQYTWIDDAFDDFLDEIRYEGDEQIVLAGTEIAGTHLNGNGKAYNMFWDLARRIRTMKEGEWTRDIQTVSTGWIGSNAGVPFHNQNTYRLEGLSQKAFLMFLPYYGEDEEEALRIVHDYYYVGDRRSIEEHSGVLNYYPLYRIPEYDGKRLLPKGQTELIADTGKEEGVTYWYENEIGRLCDPRSLADMLDRSEIVVTDREVDWNIRCMLLEVRPNRDVEDGRESLRFGDEVKLSYVTRVDGAELEDAAGTVSIFLGEGTFLPEIEESLYGMSVGESREIALTFPEPYYNQPALSGREAVVTVTIEELTSELPELYDEFIWKNTSYYSVEEYREAVRGGIAMTKKIVQTAENADRALDAIARNSEILGDYTNELNAYLVNARAYYEQYFAECGVTFQWFLETLGMDETEFNRQIQDWCYRDICREAALRMTKERLAFRTGTGLEQFREEMYRSFSLPGAEALPEFLAANAFSSTEERLLFGYYLQKILSH